MALHSRRHSVFRREMFQGGARRRVLAYQEEVVVLVEQPTVEGNHRPPLLVAGLLSSIALRVVHVDALSLNHNQPCVYTLYLGDELFLRYSFGLGLTD